MKNLKKILFTLFGEGIVKKVYYSVFKRKLLCAHTAYTRIDEIDKFDHIMEAINYIRVAGLPHCYYEFGCHSGRTFSAALRAFEYFRMSDYKAYAFDSFKGLPKTEKKIDGIFKTGSYSTNLSEFESAVRKLSGKKPVSYSSIVGFYEQSLKTEQSRSLGSPGVIHIDVDLYSSTVSVLEYLKDKIIPGSVILFDDWYCFNINTLSGEKKAMEEFLIENKKWKLIPWKSYGSFGQSFFIIDRNN
jgi:hypothetical protein